jgi:hypothetical protein
MDTNISLLYQEEKVAGSSKTLVPIYQTTWYHIREDQNLATHYCENLKFYFIFGGVCTQPTEYVRTGGGKFAV